MHKQKKSKQVLKSFDEIFSQNLKSHTKADLLDFLEFGYGEYIAQVFLKEWEFKKLLDTIEMLEIEHGKSLEMLINDEFKNIMLEDLNNRLLESTAIYEKDIKMAAVIQKSLLFEKAPVTKNYDLAFHFFPLASVSGDFYDFYIDDSKNLSGVVLADVSGHGIASGLLTALAKPIFFRLFDKNKDIPLNQIVDLINSELVNELGDSYNYLTGVILRFHDSDIEYVNAAHPDIIMKNAETGECFNVNSPVKPINGSILGISSIIIPFDSYKFHVKKNDVLIIYSDGLIESQDEKGEFFGRENIIKSLNNCPMEYSALQILDHLLKDHAMFINKIPISDDITIIVLKKNS